MKKDPRHRAREAFHLGDLTRDFSRFHPGVFPLNPQTTSAATLSLTQPLLQGAGVAANLWLAARPGGLVPAHRRVTIPDVVVQPPPKRLFQQGDRLDLTGVGHARRF